jgi:hypothetical protein
MPSLCPYKYLVFEVFGPKRVEGRSLKPVAPLLNQCRQHIKVLVCSLLRRLVTLRREILPMSQLTQYEASQEVILSFQSLFLSSYKMNMHMKLLSLMV